MARRAVMSKRKLEEAQRRYEAGATKKQLAKRYGVSPATMTRWLQDPEDRLKNRKIAAKLAQTEREISSLAPEDQVAVRSLAEQMKFTSRQMMSSAENSSAVAAQISRIANRFVGRLDETNNSQEFMAMLGEIMAMLKTSNEAAKTPMGMLQVNREIAVRDAQLESAKIDELSHDELMRIARGGG